MKINVPQPIFWIKGESIEPPIQMQVMVVSPVAEMSNVLKEVIKFLIEIDLEI